MKPEECEWPSPRSFGDAPAGPGGGRGYISSLNTLRTDVRIKAKCDIKRMEEEAISKRNWILGQSFISI